MLKSELKFSTLRDVMEEYSLCDYFDIIENDNEIILISKNKSSETPVLDELMSKLEKSNITEKDIEKAIEWARNG